MRGADFLAQSLANYQVSHVFFVEAILRRSLVAMEALGIKRVSAHSEKAAAYMADGYARLSRRPGVCMCQSVGAANLAAGLKDPSLACSPVIALTGRKPPLARYRNAYQETVHLAMFDPVTKYNVSLDALEQFPFVLRQAFREATALTPGPAHIDLSGIMGEVSETAEADIAAVDDPAHGRYPVHRPLPEPSRIAEAAGLIQKARRPVIVAGGGATASGAGPEIVNLAEKMSIPVATSLNGKGLIAGNHPLSLGVVGSYSAWCANQVVSRADLVVFIGSHTGDQVTFDWRIPGLDTPVVQIDLNPAELGRSYPDTLGLMGDAKVTVAALAAELDPGQAKEDWAGQAREVVEAWDREIEPLAASAAAPIRVERLCRDLGRVLPPDAVLLADTGWSGIWTGTMVYLNHLGQRYLRAAGSLGWAFPASLGAKCAAGERPVVCFTGDGGFYYHLGELETALRCGINTVTVINNNSSFGQCGPGIEAAYAQKEGNPKEIYRFREVNFAGLAREMGCLGLRVEKAEDLAGALEQALAAEAPAVVEVLTDPACSAPAPWAPN